MALRPPGAPESGVRIRVRTAIGSAEETVHGVRLAALELRGRTRFRGQPRVRSHLLGIAHRMALEIGRLNKELRALNGQIRTPPHAPKKRP